MDDGQNDTGAKDKMSMLGKEADLPLPLPPLLNFSIHLIHRWNTPVHTPLSLSRTSTVPTIPQQIHTAWQTKTWVWIPAPPLTGCVFRWVLSLPKPARLYNCPLGWLRWKSKTRVQKPPVPCSAGFAAAIINYSSSHAGLSKCSTAARVGKGITFCEYRKFPRTKEIFLWLHDFF